MHAGSVIAPVFVPAKTTWHVAGVQEIGLPPLFLMETEMAVGELTDEAPALIATPVTMMLVFVVALLTRL